MLFLIKVFECELKNYHTVNNGYVLYEKDFLCRWMDNRKRKTKSRKEEKETRKQHWLNSYSVWWETVTETRSLGRGRDVPTLEAPVLPGPQSGYTPGLWMVASRCLSASEWNVSRDEVFPLVTLRSLLNLLLWCFLPHLAYLDGADVPDVAESHLLKVAPGLATCCLEGEVWGQRGMLA